VPTVGGTASEESLRAHCRGDSEQGVLACALQGGQRARSPCLHTAGGTASEESLRAHCSEDSERSALEAVQVAVQQLVNPDGLVSVQDAGGILERGKGECWRAAGPHSHCHAAVCQHKVYGGGGLFAALQVWVVYGACPFPQHEPRLRGARCSAGAKISPQLPRTQDGITTDMTRASFMKPLGRGGSGSSSGSSADDPASQQACR
jgi:hypothetical protein